MPAVSLGVQVVIGAPAAIAPEVKVIINPEKTIEATVLVFDDFVFDLLSSETAIQASLKLHQTNRYVLFMVLPFLV